MKQAVESARFGLYVHWPFCTSKCPYCDFNSHVAATVDTRRWLAAYRAEIARVADATGPRILSTIFFGGGTPSLMPPDLVAAVIATARAAWTPANTLEVTLEANPGSVEAARFRDFRGAGVTRVSVGVQALDDAALRRLGRTHGTAEALAAIRIAQDTFERVSIDLIYARQDQTPDDWQRELQNALALGTGHLSLYQLTIEDGTVFAMRHARGLLRGLPDDDRMAAMFEATQALCDAAGMPAYEVSNHARPGEECRHNLIYWRGEEYAGIGPGAHGRLNLSHARVATEAVRAPGAWLDRVEKRGGGDASCAPLSRRDIAVERLLMGLRLAEGMPMAALPPDLRPSGRVTAALIKAGLLADDPEHLRITLSGRLLTDRITAMLLPDPELDPRADA